VLSFGSFGVPSTVVPVPHYFARTAYSPMLKMAGSMFLRNVAKHLHALNVGNVAITFMGANEVVVRVSGMRKPRSTRGLRIDGSTCFRSATSRPGKERIQPSAPARRKTAKSCNTRNRYVSKTLPQRDKQIYTTAVTK
jgi:hypothetical protein